MPHQFLTAGGEHTTSFCLRHCPKSASKLPLAAASRRRSPHSPANQAAAGSDRSDFERRAKMSSGNNRTIGVVIAGLALAAAGAIFLIADEAEVGWSMLAVGLAVTAVGMAVFR